MPLLTLDCRPLNAGVLITVAGEIDCGNADQFTAYAAEQRLAGQPVVLDLSRLTFMDSSGLQALLRLRAAAPHLLHVAAVHDMPARVLRITRVWDALNVHPSVDEAVAAALTAAGRTGP